MTDRVVYDTEVTAVGDQVAAFVEANILILFAHDSPAELHDISVRHRATATDGDLRAGDVLHVGDAAVPILAVGAVVADNLAALGHVDFKADGRAEPKLPGDVCVPEGSLVVPGVGDHIRVTRPSTEGAT